jgi:hypothetical protein
VRQNGGQTVQTTTTTRADGALAAPAPPRSTGAVPRPRRGIAGAIRRAPRAVRLRGGLQLPDRRNPVPHPVRLFVICSWAAGLGLLGLPVAARSSIAIIAGSAPSWFEPVVVSVGLLGIIVTAATFAAMHRRWLPWLLLLAGTLLLAGNLALTLTL